MNRKTVLALAVIIALTAAAGCKPARKPAAGEKAPGAAAGKTAPAATGCPEGMARVPAGEFTMGCQGDPACSGDEQPARKVSVGAFCIDKIEVTQKKFNAAMGRNPSNFTGCGGGCPVENVAWADAKAFCEKAGARLPLESEWEAAARAGADSRFYWGAEFSPGHAWLQDNSEGKPHETAAKKPNKLGLHDMVGNVAEWVADCYDPTWYARMPDKNPANTAAGCELHTVRGGSWFNPSANESVSSRMGFSIATHFIGFRCARNAE